MKRPRLIQHKVIPQLSACRVADVVFRRSLPTRACIYVVSFHGFSVLLQYTEKKEKYV
jgi:hypothetical protein